MTSLRCRFLVAVLVVHGLAAIGAGEEPEAEVRSALAKYARACQSRDFDALSSVFSHDPDLVLINVASPDRIVGWENVAQLYKGLFSKSGGVKMRHENISIKMLAGGKAACLTCDQDISGEFNGDAFAIEGVGMTCVLAKKGGNWRIVHVHWSLPAKPEEDMEDEQRLRSPGARPPDSPGEDDDP